MNLKAVQSGLTRESVPGRRAGTSVRAAWLAWSLCGVGLVLAMGSLLFGILNGRSVRAMLVEESIVTIATLTVAFSVVGAIIASNRPGNPIGWIFCASALCQGMIIFAEEYATYALLTEPGSLPLGAEMSWLKEWIWAPGLGLILVFLPLLFPDGELLSRRWRWVAWAGVLSISLISILYMVLLWPERGAALMQAGGEAEAELAPILTVVTDVVAFPMLLLAGMAAIISLVIRFRRAKGDERRQITWFASASAMSLGFAIAFEIMSNADAGMSGVMLAMAGVLIVPSMPIATGVAILRYRLYDIDLIINRTLVYGALSASIVAFYILFVGYLGALFHADDNLVVSLTATGIVAVVFAPFRERLQRGVDRMMYGERDDPYAVLSRLGQRLTSTDAPEAMLPVIIETVATSLRLPYAAITLKRDNDFVPVAEHGTPVAGESLVLPLIYGTETIGQMILTPRAPGERLDPADNRLLDGLARHAEAAVYAVRLTADLQRSRERLVTAREEERRRLRRDLHDGLGPQLATLTLKLDAVRNLLGREPGAVDPLLVRLKSQTQTAISDIRRLVYDLRPPTLDELGLIPAVREQAANCSQSGLQVTVEAPTDLPPLPAAVEVAAFRIVQEALTNVVRHAQAQRCRVNVAVIGDHLQIEIADDGAGLPEDRRAGIGLFSMRERATELGGTCRVERSISGGGTHVLAVLPLASFGDRP